MRQYTKVEIKFNKKKGYYIISIEYKEGSHESGISGAKIYIIGNHYVLTQWGSGEPIAVFTNKEEIKDHFQKKYNFTPVIID